MSKRRSIAAALLPAALILSACGSSSSNSSSSSAASTGTEPVLKYSITESGKTASISGPTRTPGGLVHVDLKNQGKQPHSLQFVLVEGNHSLAEAYKLVNSNSPTTPSWLRALGGVSTTMPGQTGVASTILEPGKYLVTEVGGPGSSAPAKGELNVTGTSTAPVLPNTGESVTAAATGKDRYQWQIHGLHSGENQLTFNSQGREAIHFIGVIKLRPGQNPSLAAIQKSFASNGPPPWADPSSPQTTAVLDGGRSQVANLNLQPGTYVFFCPLTDRDGGKPHLAEGLLTKYTVK